jgi:hypothetical protein
MKAFIESRRAFTRRAGLILPFDGEVGHSERQARRLSYSEGHDEHCQTDILTPGLEPHSRLPDFSRNQWLWEFVARYSGATVPEFHGVP